MRHQRFFTTSLLVSLVAFGCDVDAEEYLEAEEHLDAEEYREAEVQFDAEERVDSLLLEQADEGDMQAISEDGFEPTLLGASPGDPSVAADCVYVEWCDKPGPWGTVCQVRPGCQLNNAARNECTADANAVCGGITYPRVIILR